MRTPSSPPVVVGVTGTSAGLAAARLAAREAVCRDAELRVIHAFTWPGAGSGDVARRRATAVVDEAVASAKRSTPAVRVTGHLEDGAAEQVLCRLSRAAALIVLGDDDLATLPWLPPSSVLVQTVARSWCPVLVARGPRPPAGPLVVAVDGSRCSLVALRLASLEARRREAPLEVVHVGDKRPDIKANVRLVPGDPGPTLIHLSSRARMMVLGPRGTHAEGLLGSVAREVLHRAACPTLFVHGSATLAKRTQTALTERADAPI